MYEWASLKWESDAVGWYGWLKLLDLEFKMCVLKWLEMYLMLFHWSFDEFALLLGWDKMTFKKERTASQLQSRSLLSHQNLLKITDQLDSLHKMAATVAKVILNIVLFPQESWSCSDLLRVVLYYKKSCKLFSFVIEHFI